uniref:complement component C9 n=1 Tax=Pristiophorus japonicus TaxID=55135 RepID=UPI00398E6932
MDDPPQEEDEEDEEPQPRRRQVDTAAGRAAHQRFIAHRFQSRLDGEARRRRTERAVNTPAMIPCELSPWGQWSPCQPCKGLRYRSRSITQFGQFGGRTCTDLLSNEESCPITGNCEEPPVNCGSNFQCDSGKCISRRLMCNEDNDCGDYTDEDYCEKYRPSCRKVMEPLEIGQTAGSGVNIFGMEPRRSPFNNKFYNGDCQSVYDGSRRTHFRIPWNIVTFIYQTRMEQHFTTEVYESMSQVVTNIIEETTSNFNLGWSLRLQNPYVSGMAGFNLKGDLSRNLNKMLNHTQSQTEQYIRVKGQVQLAEFRMRRNRYELDEDFIVDLKSLPIDYDKGVYFKLLDDYGTHYTSSGVLGGDYQMVYVLDKSEMTKQHITTEFVKACLGLNANLNIQQNVIKGKNDSSLGLDQKFEIDKCHKVTKGYKETKQEKPLIKDVMSFVNGGDVVFLTKLNVLLAAKSAPVDASIYSQWASSLTNSATLVRQQAVPIQALVPVAMTDAAVIRRNLERAIADYEAEYNVCKCAPCQNGGTVIQLDGQCRCLCPITFQGIACETPKLIHTGKVDYTDGQWSCWSGWSPCIDRQQVRTRQCLGTQGEGTPCQGEQQSVAHC